MTTKTWELWSSRKNNQFCCFLFPHLSCIIELLAILLERVSKTCISISQKFTLFCSGVKIFELVDLLRNILWRDMAWCCRKFNRQANANRLLDHRLNLRRRSDSCVDSLRVRPLFAFQNLSLDLFVSIIDMCFSSIHVYHIA